MFRGATAKYLFGKVSRKGYRSAFSTVATKTTEAQRTSSAFAMVAGFASVAMATNVTFNHCQVPCGIFDDPAVVNKVKQDCQTIRKAMVESDKLWKDSKELQSINQVARWIKTKEEHCDYIIQAMSDYCLCQRVKRANFKSEEEYLQALKMHHTVMQAAMKAKQTMDPKACDDLEHAVEDLSKMYT